MKYMKRVKTYLAAKGKKTNAQPKKEITNKCLVELHEYTYLRWAASYWHCVRSSPKIMTMFRETRVHVIFCCFLFCCLSYVFFVIHFLFPLLKLIKNHRINSNSK